LYIALGVVTEIRSAFQSNPKTDFQVYARAAWAVRAGEDLYAVTDDNGWHYIYPPPFAILLAPLADPYPFASHDGYLPFWLSSAIWYLIGFACVVYTVHSLAGAVLPDADRGARRWWSARVIPTLFCFSGITLTISRGQVNTVVVALVAAGFAAAMRNRRWVSGAWLAAAAVLKIIPVMLVLFPLARRDWRGAVGGLLAAAVLLVALPAAVWGLPGALDANRKTVLLVLAPVIQSDGDHSRQEELHGANSTHSQSVQAAIHTWMFPDRETRPNVVAPVAKWAHLLSAAAMLGISVYAGRRLSRYPADQLIYLGCLCAVMMLATPISHLHYYMMVMPLVCGLWLRSLSLRPGLISADAKTMWMLSIWGFVTAIPMLPGMPFEWLREAGLGTAATILLWAQGLRIVVQNRELHAND